MEFHYDQINTNSDRAIQRQLSFLPAAKPDPTLRISCSAFRANTTRASFSRFTAAINIAGLYAQDSWRLRSNLTLNYGLRWDRIEPWYEKNNGISTFETRKTVGGFSRRACRNFFSGRSRRAADAGASREIWISLRELAWLIRRARAQDSLLGKNFGRPGKDEHSSRIRNVLHRD